MSESSGAPLVIERFSGTHMKTISLPDGTIIPMLGQGTWRMGEGERTATGIAEMEA